jgi:hypothetical protein
MTELFEPLNEPAKKAAADPPPERISSDAIVFLFFYFAIGAGIFFALRWLLPGDTPPGYVVVLFILYGSWWLYGKFLRRS